MVCPTFPTQERTCGVGDYTRHLVDALASQGEDVTVWASAACRPVGQSRLRILARGQTWSLREALDVARLRLEPPIDILHLQYTPDLYVPGAGFRWLPLLRRLRPRGTPTLITFHTLVGPSLGSRLTALVLLATAHHIISANEEVTAMVRRRFPGRMRRVTEIPIGANVPVTAVSDTDCEAGRRLLGVPLASDLLVHFGLLYPGKGLETLFASLVDLRRTRPDTRLAIVGDTRPEDADYRASLEILAARLGVAPAIIWAGRRSAEEVSRILRSADAFVVPYDDGASIRRSSLIAGLAHGLPVVSTTPTCVSSFLKDGANISLVPPRSPQALSARIASILATPAEAARLAEGARRLADRFSWEAIARDTRTLYAQVRQ